MSPHAIFVQLLALCSAAAFHSPTSRILFSRDRSPGVQLRMQDASPPQAWEPAPPPSGPPTALVPCKIKVIGVGGGGGNAIIRMIETGVVGVEFSALNTDQQALGHPRFSSVETLNIGAEISKGLGAGGISDVGRQAAEESRMDIQKLVERTFCNQDANDTYKFYRKSLIRF